MLTGLTLEGAVVEQDNDATRAICGHNMRVRSILIGQSGNPWNRDAFLKAVAEASHKAHVADAREDSKQ